MRQRPSNVRFAILTSALALLLPAAACAPGGGNANATNAGATNSAATNSTTTNAAGANAAATNQAASAPAGQGAKLNLNTASREEFLAKVPSLGDRMAHEFEEYRPYRSIQQFRREMAKYVAAAQIAEYERHVFVPVDENAADAATLQQLPGLDEKEAAELIAGRPYASRDAFLARLAEKVSPEELSTGRGYLITR